VSMSGRTWAIPQISIAATGQPGRVVSALMALTQRRNQSCTRPTCSLANQAGLCSASGPAKWGRALSQFNRGRTAQTMARAEAWICATWWRLPGQSLPDTLSKVFVSTSRQCLRAHYIGNKAFDSHEGIVAGCVKPLALSSTERRDKGPLARLPTALRPSGSVQQWIFHQAEQELTTLPVLRYGSGHRKR